MKEQSPVEDRLTEEDSDEGEPKPASQPFQVAIADEAQTLSFDPARLTAAAQAVLADSNYSSAQVSIAVVDDPAIHRLNVEFLNHDYPTDVLSFVLEDRAECLEAELVVSVDTARREAAEVGWSAEDELLLYVIHGTLHLVGYEDQDADRRREMQAAEKALLERLHVALPSDASRWQVDACDDAASIKLQAPEESVS